MSNQRRPDLLTEYGRRQRRAVLENKYQRLRFGNPAEESARANIPFEDRANIPPPVEDSPKQDAPVEIDQPHVEEDLKEDHPVEIDQHRVEPDSPIEPKEKTLMAKPTVVIVGADKGGVGKTTVARTVLDYFKHHGV